MSTIVNDRAAGAIFGTACGDALGAGYEFGPPLPDGAVVRMQGGGGFGWAPGEWTDDTSMAVPILQAVAAGESLAHEAVLDHLVATWAAWSREAKDVGVQTSQVLRGLRSPTAQAARAAAKAVHDRAGRSGGNGSLMRTAPVALAFLGDTVDGLAEAAGAISGLTHFEPDAADACVLWCAAIRHAIRHGEFDVRGGLPLLPADRRARWAALIDEAEMQRPRDFPNNGWVVQAFQAAWCAIATTPVPEEVPARHLRLALEAAVRGGNDTDTVAAIAGGLLGARWGASAVPAAWRRILHGWPGLDAPALTRLAVLAVDGGTGDGTGWPAAERVRPFGARTLVTHPHDDGVLLGSLAALDDLPADVDVVVSLCRTGRRQTDREQVEFWLIDQDGSNPNLDLVLRDAADTVAALRAEGKRVLLHCAEGRSRTPSVGALYSVLHRGVPADRALAEVTAALPEGAPQRFLQDAVLRIARTTPTVTCEERR